MTHSAPTNVMKPVFVIVAIASVGLVSWIAFSPRPSPSPDPIDAPQNNQSSSAAIDKKPTLTLTPTPIPKSAISETPSAAASSSQSTSQANTIAATVQQTSLDSCVSFPRNPVAVEQQEMELEAARVAADLVKKIPNNANALHVAALCSAQLHKASEAQRLWMKCVEISPKSETFYLNAAANALYLGETDAAIEVLQKARANGIDSLDISHHYGLALSRIGEDEQAVEVLKKALEKDPTLAGHWMLLGQSELKLNRLQDAKTSLNKAVDLGMKSNALFLALLNVSSRLGDKESARAFQKKIEENSDQTVGDGRQQFRVNSDKDAKRILITVLGEANVVYLASQMFENAEQGALRILAIEPSHYGTCKFLADMYRDRKMPAEELATRQRMLEINPSDLINHLQAARILSDAGYPKRCEAAIKTVTIIAPQRALGFAAMAEFLVSQGQFQKAKWYAEQALERERSPGGLTLLDNINKALGKKNETK